MNIIRRAFLPLNVFNEMVWPDITSGRIKSGAVVPRSSIVESVLTICKTPVRISCDRDNIKPSGSNLPKPVRLLIDFTFDLYRMIADLESGIEPSPLFHAPVAFSTLNNEPLRRVLMTIFTSRLRFPLWLIILSLLMISPSLFADGGANHQTRNQHFGVSGGNINDITRAFCCSGTLGALVTDGTTQYVLSNNHVLARSDQALPGDDISQPGLIDNSCRPGTIVADFTLAPPLGSNVDAAIAALRPGTMDSTGFIEDIGVPSSAIATPTVGLAVAKSGRTTGFTTASIGSVNTSVNVQYQKNCGSGRKFVISYTNQVVINSSSFSAGGDSGSLIVTNDSNHNPVALLYAGSNTTTIGNPIGEVLGKLEAALPGTASLSFVGSGGGRGGPRGRRAVITPQRQGNWPSDEGIQFATLAMRQRERDLLSRPSVIGVGVGSLDSNPTEAAIVVYVDQTAAVRPRLPRRLNGVRVKVVGTDPIVAY